jgi:hypothetical protein
MRAHDIRHRLARVAGQWGGEADAQCRASQSLQQGVARWTNKESTLRCSGRQAKHRFQPIIFRTKLPQVEMRWLLSPEQCWAKAVVCWTRPNRRATSINGAYATRSLMLSNRGRSWPRDRPSACERATPSCFASRPRPGTLETSSVPPHRIEKPDQVFIAGAVRFV